MAPAGRHPRVVVTLRGRRRIEARHPWVFADDVARADAAHGDLVEVRDASGAELGAAFYSSRSKITLRVAARSGEPLGPALWSRRVDQATARRGLSVAAWNAKRVVFGEGDGLPGLIADLYGAHLVVQAQTAGVERVLPELIAAIRERYEVASVLARNDSAARALEGLPREVRQIDGGTPHEIDIDESGIRFAIDPWTGQKTGAFLDQRENRIAASAYARGRVLDAFAYHGSFGLHAARHADEVVALDASSEALERARANAARNGLTHLRCVEANAFDALKEFEQAGERFDLVLLDPPAFAKSRKDVPAAVRGYREINLRGFKLLAPGGVLVTSSCSYNLDEDSFLRLLREAAAGAERDAVVLERRSQAADHPVRIGFPEGRYLKCFILRDAQGAS